MVDSMRESLLLAIFCIFHAQSCSISKMHDRMICDTLAALSAEGNVTWNSVIITNPKHIPITIKANSFTATPNLKKLFLTRVVQIEEEAFNGLKNIDLVSIFDSNLKEAPKGIFDNLTMQVFQITRSCMEDVPTGFFDNLDKVRLVNFSNNTIRTVKARVYNNSLIYKLNLNNNAINTIEDGAFANMENLDSLLLKGNQLESFDSYRALGTTNSLYYLDLGQNNLTKITRQLLGSTPYLDRLYVYGNKIDSIEDGSFDKVPYLITLDLSNNLLTNVQPQIFPVIGLPKLGHLFLHSNKLTFISKALFFRAPALRYITFRGNPLQCPCLAEINQLRMKLNISEACDYVYHADNRPNCVHTEHSQCLNDLDLTKDLAEKYNTVVRMYPEVRIKCLVSYGKATPAPF